MPVAASKLYAVQVLSGKEAEVQRMLLRLLPDLIEDCFTPEYETVWARKGAWVPVRRMLLPGYLFIQTKEPEVVAAKLAAVPAFTRLLGGDGERFMPLAADEVAWLSAFADVETHVVAMSTGVIEGDRVIVLRGPLKGHEGLIARVDRHKRIAELEMKMFGRVKRIRVELEIVAKS